MLDVLGVVGARRVADLEARACERGEELGDNFFERVSEICEALALLAVQPLLRAAPMTEFVKYGGIKGFACGACRRAGKVLGRRDLDTVLDPLIKRP